jgi:hypothetical protein
MRVVHREYVAEVAGTTAWTTTKYPIQAAIQTLFVWLSTVASNFEKYRFRKLRFCYETESPTSQAGSIVFVVDYDALDAAPTSKQEALSSKCFARGAPWEEFSVDCDLSSDAQVVKLWTRSTDVPSGADARLYDVGNLFVGTQGASGSTGELWVEYDVELHTPQAANPVGAKLTASSGLDADSLIGSDAAFSTNSAIGWEITDADTLTCNIAGWYLFVASIAGGTLVSTGFVQNGTATLSTSGVAVNSAGTAAQGQAVVFATVGQTFAPAVTSAASVSATTWKVARYRSV